MKKKIVIVGGVAGGATAAARLRRLDEDLEIVILERGKYISYANCGLPYHIGDVIKSRDSLLLQTPEAMKTKYNIEVRVQNEVCSIDRENKKLEVINHLTGDNYEEYYDTLLLSTGSSPLKPPIPGIDSPNVKTLWTVSDTDDIKSYIDKEKVSKAVVVGGGFIGLEMAENLHLRGIDVSLVEMQDQVMAPFDFEMAQLLHEHLENQGVHLYLEDGVTEFEDSVNGVNLTLSSGKVIETDLVILSIGVRPNGELARESGLEMNQRGGILVDEYMVTSDPNIYAVGDVIEVLDTVTNNKTMVPLAGPANKQGRIAADNMAFGLKGKYKSTQGTSVAQVFNLDAASTGANEKTLNRNGLIKGRDYESVIITQNSHAGYYPGAFPLTLKLIFSITGDRVLGAQIIGEDGVDKRIDVIATAIRLEASIKDLTELELAYAPPYSSAKDPVNMAGYTAENLIAGRVNFCHWDTPLSEEKNENLLLLDVRESAEIMAFEIPGAKHIPLGELRDRLDEIDSSKNIVTFCAIGVRSYNAARILMNNGFENVSVYPGGTRFLTSTHYKIFNDESETKEKHEQTDFTKEENTAKSLDDKISISINCSGMQCPGPIMQVFETINTMEDGQVLEVTASDPGFAKDIESWSRRTGNTLISNEKDGNSYIACVRKGSSNSEIVNNQNKVSEKSKDGKTIVVFSGDMDKVLASFVIANGAAAMGRPVTMFFTFWGLNVLRKENSPSIEKPFMEKMFSGMMPKGINKLKLSKMNMGGLGTAMMKRVMNDKNVDSLETLIKKGQENGIKMVACTMSMDVMGIREEELIGGVELAGVGSYLGDAEESNVNLFI